ncbi:hypothetical protein [Magnetovibrio sp.]|uniref:hypothetical protein n=1 Tax=Magnetovibrio sp. TaxID=2024836 RepID=UPI002F923259
MDDSSAKAGLDELVNSVVDSIKMTSAVEDAVGKLQVSTLDTASTVTDELIKNNVSSPELAQENLKLQKAIIEKTIAAIHALGPKDDSSSDSGS